MVMVPTVRGPVDVTALGTTFMHEHVFVLTADVQQNYADEWDEESRVADAVARLTELRGLGVETIVDPTVVGLGRNIPRIARINQQVDINILVATGVYTYHDVPFFFHHRGPALDPNMPDPMVDLFVRDLTEGIAGTGVKAALLKCAVDHDGMNPGVERVLKAVAAAHRRDTTDADHLQQLADMGVMPGMRRFGIDTVLGTPDRVATVVEMCRRG